MIQNSLYYDNNNNNNINSKSPTNIDNDKKFSILKESLLTSNGILIIVDIIEGVSIQTIELLKISLLLNIINIKYHYYLILSQYYFLIN
jgi:hypothetical protein